MGYAKTYGYANTVEVGSGVIGGTVIDTASGTILLNIITVPTGYNVEHAFIDLYVGCVQNTSAAGTNYLNCANPQIWIGTIGGVQAQCSYLPSMGLETVASGRGNGFSCRGSFDVKGYINGGDSKYIWLVDTYSRRDLLMLKDYEVVARLVVS